TIVQPVDLPTGLDGVMTREGCTVREIGVAAETILNVLLEQFVFLLEPASGPLPRRRYVYDGLIARGIIDSGLTGNAVVFVIRVIITAAGAQDQLWRGKIIAAEVVRTCRRS